MVLSLPGWAGPPPVRKVQSKRFITKVMFIAAVARSRHNPATNSAFDGKIGLWAFTEKVPAVRSSRNRPAGTLVTKCVEVTKETYKAKLIDGVIPAIKASGRLPRGTTPSSSSRTTRSRTVSTTTRTCWRHVPRMDSTSKSSTSRPTALTPTC